MPVRQRFWDSRGWDPGAPAPPNMDSAAFLLHGGRQVMRRSTPRLHRILYFIFNILFLIKYVDKHDRQG